MQNPLVQSPFTAGNFHHTGIVVRNMDKAIEHLESLGIGPFSMPGDQKWIDIPFKGELHGKPAQWITRISNAEAGEHEIELLQPCGGASLLQEFLDEHGEGVHHIAYLVDDVKGELQKLANQGLEVLTSADLATRGFAYVRTGTGGLVIEIRWR